MSKNLNPYITPAKAERTLTYFLNLFNKLRNNKKYSMRVFNALSGDLFEKFIDPIYVKIPCRVCRSTETVRLSDYLKEVSDYSWNRITYKRKTIPVSRICPSCMNKDMSQYVVTDHLNNNATVQNIDYEIENKYGQLKIYLKSITLKSNIGATDLILRGKNDVKIPMIIERTS